MSESSHLKQILVGVDEDGRSDAAVRVGLDLARRLGANVELLHSVPVPPPLWPDINPVQLASINAEALTEAWRALSERFHDDFQQSGFGGHPVEDLLRVMPGHPAQVMIDRANETGADLIVLGPHKKRRLLDFGSTARAVLAKAPGSVWVQPGEYREIRQILVPVDLSDHSLLALERVKALAAVLKAEVKTLHCFAAPEIAYSYGLSYPIAGPTYVVDEAREATREGFEKVMADFDWGDVSHSAVFTEGDAVTQILELGQQADLIALGTHGRTGLSAAVLGNVAYGVLKESETPVLALRHPEREWLT